MTPCKLDTHQRFAPTTQVLAPHMQTYHGTVAQPSQTGVFAPSCGPQLMQSVAGLQLSREHRTIFFAGCTPIVSSETIYALFSQFGRVEDINLFRPYSGSKTSKVRVLAEGLLGVVVRIPHTCDPMTQLHDRVCSVRGLNEECFPTCLGVSACISRLLPQVQ